MNEPLAQIGRIVLHYNALEKHCCSILRQFIIEDFSDRNILGLCEGLTGVELQRNLRRFALQLDREQNGLGCEDLIKHLIKVLEAGKSLRNRIVHELDNSIQGAALLLHKHVFRPDPLEKKFVLSVEVLNQIVEWMAGASKFSAKIGIELSFIRKLRNESERQFMPGCSPGWPDYYPLLTWSDLEVE